MCNIFEYSKIFSDLRDFGNLSGWCGGAQKPKSPKIVKMYLNNPKLTESMIFGYSDHSLERYLIFEGGGGGDFVAKSIGFWRVGVGKKFAR